MKLRIDGTVGKQEILEAVAQLLNSLEDAGVDEFRAVNFYITPMRGGLNVKPLVNGEEADILHKSTQKHLVAPANTNGESISKRITGVNPEEINLTRRYNSESIRIELRRPKSSNTKKNQERKKRREKEVADRSERQALLELKRKSQREIRLKRKDVESKCIKSLKQLLQLTNDQYITNLSSTGWLSTRKGIEQYTSTVNTDTAFRITMKRGKGEKGKVYLFDEESKLLFESA